MSILNLFLGLAYRPCLKRTQESFHIKVCASLLLGYWKVNNLLHFPFYLGY